MNKKYVWNKNIFRLAFLVMLGLFVLVWGMDGFQDPTKFHVYVSCPADGPACENPFYTGCDDFICPPNQPIDQRIDYSGGLDNLSSLPPGFSYGVPQTPLAKYFSMIIVVVLGCAFFLNHFLHNKGFRILKKTKKLIKEVQDERL